jgi:aryl-alcohol dehydrogenase-like predicted oxidoreductase
VNQKPLQTRIFGSTHQNVTRTGLGGEGVLRTHGRHREARAVIQAAIAQGINYFDSARVYADSELYYGYIWKEQPELRAKVFQASKSPGRDKASAVADLQQSLERLQTDYLDLWQIHDVRTPQDIALIAGPGGALEAFVEAKAAGIVRFIGVTGHLGGFLTDTLPAARKKGVAVIGMKVLGAAHFILPRTQITAAALIRYALSFDIDVAIVGCATPAEVETLAETGRMTQPLAEKERRYLSSMFKPIARQLAYYRGVLDSDLSDA